MKVANYYPDRITVTERREYTYTDKIDSWLNRYHKKESPAQNLKQLENLEKGKSTLDLSPSSVRSLRNSVNSLVFLSKPRTITRKNRNPIYNFRASFITLTLPSSQSHSDTEIKKCLNLFLTDLRRVYGLQNYVWRSELQENGNIHFHLVIDIYIHHKIIRNYWLKALRHTGYVQEYQKRFRNLTFKQYFDIRLKGSWSKNQTFEDFRAQCVKAYAYGRRTDWLSPNCADVRSIFNVNQISAYVSKYMAKETKQKNGLDNSPKSPEEVPDRIKNFGKIWGRSNSLSGLKYIFPLVLDSAQPFIKALQESGSVITKVYDYATIHYFNFKKMPQRLYLHLHRKIMELATTWDYPLVT